MVLKGVKGIALVYEVWRGIFDDLILTYVVMSFRNVHCRARPCFVFPTLFVYGMMSACCLRRAITGR